MKSSIVAIIFVLFLLPTIFHAAQSTNANRFFIIKPVDSIIGTPITITIEARKDNDVDINYQNDVTLITSGSATGGGVVDIINGIGTVTINDEIAETVALSLSDTESTGLDTSSTQEVTFSVSETAAWHQQKFLFRDDDGDEITATGFGAENVGQNRSIINIIPGTAFRLRFAIKLTAANDGITPQLEFGREADCATGSWETITSSSNAFSFRPSESVTDGAPTTQQLVGGPNFIAGQFLESTNPTNSLNMLKNESTEYEWSLEASRDIPFATTYNFRVTNKGAVLNTYDQCPSLTIQAAPPSPPTPSGEGGGGGAKPTMITFLGKAFPGAKVLIVDKVINNEKIVSQDVIASNDGSFEVNFAGILQGQHSFGLIVKDKESRATQTKFFNIDNFTSDLVVKNVIISPTVGFINHSVTRGRMAILTGYASPESVVVFEIDDKIVKEAIAGDNGAYTLEVNTSALEFGAHRVRAKQIITRDGKESDFSPTKILMVSRLFLPKVDLSGDGKVDIKDWSMFLFYWLSKDVERRKIIDFNNDGRVDISDFGIFIKNVRKE